DVLRVRVAAPVVGELDACEATVELEAAILKRLGLGQTLHEPILRNGKVAVPGQAVDELTQQLDSQRALLRKQRGRAPEEIHGRGDVKAALGSEAGGGKPLGGTSGQRRRPLVNEANRRPIPVRPLQVVPDDLVRLDEAGKT